MSPIITVQRRMAEQGRIRLGQKVATSGGRTRPDKLDRFRFTSASQRLIEAVAATYGGKAQPWDNDGKSEWEVITDARSIPVIVVKGGFSQWHEFWTKGGCKHRCDGEKDPAGNYCNPQDTQHLQAIEKPTTRLSVMLEQIEGLGVWRMETHGWNAAAELPSMAELAMHVGDLVPATLYLAERSSIIQTSKGPQTSRYVVPGLDLAVTKGRLVELVGGAGGMAALEGASNALQIEAATAPDYAAMLEDAQTVEEAQAVWHAAGKAGHLDDDLKARIAARGRELAAATTPDAAPEQAPSPADDGEGDAWMSCVMFAGEQGWSTDQLIQLFEETYAVPVGDGEGLQFRDFLQQLRAGAIKAA